MSPVKKLMNILMLSCKKASGLIEKKLHFPLSPIQKMQLFMHTSMCDTCKKYQKQSLELDSILRGHIQFDSQSKYSSSEKLSTNVKNQIISKLKGK